MRKQYNPRRCGGGGIEYIVLEENCCLKETKNVKELLECQSLSLINTTLSNLKSYHSTDIRKTTQIMDIDSKLIKKKNMPAFLFIEKYNGIMGVPITFLDKYNPNQFEIIGLAPERCSHGKEKLQIKKYINAVQHKKDGTICSGGKVNDGPTILHDVRPNKYPYYTSETVPDKFLEVLYARILIRRKV